MGNIIILDENTANKIAAGEVIERPASVIKELVENSIDAGADNISVEIRNGGISFIRVIDNGSGISEDDVEMSFERHATSKIRSVDDLDSITSMGFRGEALASIAAVSDIQLTTRVKSSVQGVSVNVKGGCVLEIKPVGCPIGTSLAVRELFFNTPARYKFLKKDSTEAGNIADVLNRIALGYPDISFKMVSNGSVLFHTPGNNDLKSTVFSIYGAETAKHLLPVNYEDEHVKITGYIGKAEIARSNRNHQSVFVNRRYIRNRTISSAIDSAYSTFLMKNKHPFVLIDIRLNPATVDVNVHPSKMEVKFSNEQDIFRAVYHVINGTLLSQSTIRTLPGSDNAPGNNNYSEKQAYSTKSDYATKSTNSTKPAYTFSEKQNIQPAYTQQDFEHVRKELDRKREEAISGKSYEASVASDVTTTSEVSATSETLQKDVGQELQRYESTGSEAAPSVGERTAAYSLFNNARIIGQAFSTYILLEAEECLFLLDQHAAHERIRYEELKSAYDKKEPLSQMLISGVPVELTPSEYQFALAESAFFESMGFSFESFGQNVILLRAVPFVQDNTDTNKLFLEILEFVMSDRKGEKSIIADETLYTMACKSAVKANKKMSEPEIQALLDRLSELENPYTCPHGRPAILKLRQYELEKLFKRIV